MLHTSVLMSPEAFDAYRDGYIRFMETTQAKGLVAWVAAADVEGMAMMVQKFEQVFALTNTRFQLFADMAPARTWIEGNLAAMKSSAPD